MMDEQKNFPRNSDTELPAHLQVSHDSDKNPWRNLFMQDFVLVAEFSEHEGPRPLFCVPEAAGEVFDKNAFAVHVMSVDYQRHTNSAFSFVDDTQLIFSEDRENFYAYVHHFILYDIEARGFVRPFCMCYISNSKKKILSNLEQFIQEFSKISKHFKAFNKQLFHGDLKQRLADLAYVKDCLQNCQSEHSDWIEFPKNLTKNFHGLNSETIDSMLVETTFANKVVETDQLINRVVRNGVETNGNEESNFRTGHFEGVTTCIADGEDWNTEEEEAMEIPDAFSGHSFNEEQIHDEVIQRLLRERRRHLLTFRDLDKLCGFHAADGVACLQKLHQHFYQPFEVFSVVKEETPMLDPYSSLFTIGGSLQMNFLKHINLSLTEPSFCGTSTTVDSYGSAHSVLSAESFKSCYEENDGKQERFQNDDELIVYSSFQPVTNEYLLGKNYLSHYSSCSTVDVNDQTNENSEQSSQHSKHENGRDGSKTLSTTVVNIAHYKQPAFVSRGHVPNIRSRSTNDLPSFTNRPQQAFQRQFSAVESRSNLMDDLHENVAYTPKRWDVIATNVSHSWADIDHYQLGSTPQYRIVYKDGCQDNDSDPDKEAMYDSFDRIFVQCYAQQLCRRKADGPGGGILRVFKNYGYLVHLLYALLRGRTVVVLAEPCHQRNVRSLITALWLFVPGHFRGCQKVVLWRTKPIKLTDLGILKLVGLSKSKQFNVLPNSVQTYITTLDFESGCLKTPPYQGEFLNEMLASRHCWKGDTLFLAHIQSVFLEISLKAFVCYFATLFRSSNEDANLSWRKNSAVPMDFSNEYMRDILDALGILGSDTHIILYFLDVIIQQQLTDLSPTSQMSDSTSFDSVSYSSTTSYDQSGCFDHATKARPISLDFTRCLTYKKSSRV